jgi:hypothetical protein
VAFFSPPKQISAYYLKVDHGSILLHALKFAVEALLTKKQVRKVSYYEMKVFFVAGIALSLVASLLCENFVNSLYS